MTSEAPHTIHTAIDAPALSRLERNSRTGRAGVQGDKVDYTPRSSIDICTVAALLKLSSPSIRLLECASVAQHRLVGRRGGSHRRNRDFPGQLWGANRET